MMLEVLGLVLFWGGDESGFIAAIARLIYSN